MPIKEYPTAYRRGSLQVDGAKRLGFQMPLVPEIALPTTVPATQLGRTAVIRTFGRKGLQEAEKQLIRLPLPLPLKIVAGIAVVAGTILLFDEISPDPDAVQPGDPWPYDMSGWVHHPDPGTSPPYTFTPDGGEYFWVLDEPANPVAGNIVNKVLFPERDQIFIEDLRAGRLRTGSSEPYSAPGLLDGRMGEWWSRTAPGSPPLWTGPTRLRKVFLPQEIVEEVRLPWRDWHRRNDPRRDAGYGDPQPDDTRTVRTIPLEQVLVVDVPGVGTSPDASPKPGEPEHQPAPSPGGNAPPPAVHEYAPPRQGERERKAYSSGKLGLLLLGTLGKVTEALDVLEALHDALPPEFKAGWYKLHKRGGEEFYLRRRSASPQEMVADLWAHWNEIDLNDALVNIIKNQLEDAAIGRLGSEAQRQARPLLELLNRPVGLGTGPAV